MTFTVRASECQQFSCRAWCVTAILPYTKHYMYNSKRDTVLYFTSVHNNKRYIVYTTNPIYTCYTRYIAPR